MTRPAPTYCEHEGRKYEAVGFYYPHWRSHWDRDLDEIDRRGFIIPPDVGIGEVPRCSTACWHGYRYGLLIEGDRLVIDKMVIMLDPDEPLPKINGVSGELVPYDWWSSNGPDEPPDPVWSGLGIPTTFTGSLPLVGPYEGERGPYVAKGEPVAPAGRSFPWPDHLQLEVRLPMDRLMTPGVAKSFGDTFNRVMAEYLGSEPPPEPTIDEVVLRRRRGRASWLHRYRGLLDVHVEEGRVVRIDDRSEELRRIRMQLGDYMQVLLDRAREMISEGASTEAIVAETGALPENIEALREAHGST